MEREPHDNHEEEQHLLPVEAAPDAREVGAAPQATIEFGSLELIPPEGSWWGDWVITRGIAEAEREGRPIDHRTAHYVAAYLSESSTPALRSLARTGAIDMPGLQEEMVARTPRQPGEVQTWLGWLADYCRTRRDRGPLDNWRPAIRDQDRLDAEWLRREQVFASLDDLFQKVPPIQRVGHGADPGWQGFVRHEDRPGGWIVSEGVPGGRRVWETDSDAELEQRYVAVVEAQRQWVVDTFGGTAETTKPEATTGQTGPPDDLLHPPAD